MGKETGSNQQKNPITWLLLAGLLILRLPFLTGLILISYKDPLWVDAIYQIGTYILTSVLIWWERDRLASNHIDPLVVAMVILFKPLSAVILPVWGQGSPLEFPKPLSFSFLIISIGLLVCLWRSEYRFGGKPGKSFAWLLVGALGGALMALVYTLIKMEFYNIEIPHPVDSIALISPIYQMGYAAVDEEPLFRAFLWGALRRLGLKDLWILLIQAALFALGHYYRPGSDLAGTFFLALCLGLLAWRSRTIASSMGFHAFWNGSAFLVTHIAAMLFK
jgi:membrane protease YdiL (CAAX protease family)